MPAIKSKADLLETVKPNRLQAAPSTKNDNSMMMVAEKTSKAKEEKKILNLITTNLTSGLQEDVDKFVRMFKGKIYKEFSENITHVIVYPNQDAGSSQAKRTLKYLHGLIEGCWIVTYRCKYLVLRGKIVNCCVFLIGIQDSIVRNQVLDEEDYEITEDGFGVGAPKFCRLQVDRIFIRLTIGLTLLFVGRATLLVLGYYSNYRRRQHQ